MYFCAHGPRGLYVVAQKRSSTLRIFIDICGLCAGLKSEAGSVERHHGGHPPSPQPKEWIFFSNCTLCFLWFHEWGCHLASSLEPAWPLLLDVFKQREIPTHNTHEPRAVTMKFWEPKRKCPKAVSRHLQHHVMGSRIPPVQCEVICDRALNQLLFQRISIHAGPHTW